MRLGGRTMRAADPTATVVDPNAVPSPIDLGQVTVNGQDAGAGVLITAGTATTPPTMMDRVKQYAPWALGIAALAGAWWYFGREEGGAYDDRPLVDG